MSYETEVDAVMAEVAKFQACLERNDPVACNRAIELNEHRFNIARLVRRQLESVARQESTRNAPGQRD